MRQKTLNKIGKYCKFHNLRVGQLFSRLIWTPLEETGNALFNLPDAEFEKRFLKLYSENPPIRDRGGYYPHGHKKDVS